MLQSFLFEPFADAAAEARADALQLALPEQDLTGLLLLNLPLGEELLDAVLVLPKGLAILRLLPGGHRLHAAQPAQAPWQLDGQPLPGFLGTDNPYQQLQRQRAALRAWLPTQLPASVVPPPSVALLAVFDGLVAAGPELTALEPGTDLWGVVTHPSEVLAWVQAASTTSPLPPTALLAWANALHKAAEPDSPPVPESAWGRAARRVWAWLGADDVPADLPYGTAPSADTHAEQARLEQLRQQVVQEMQQQRQAMEAREAARDQALAELRRQLATSEAAAPETARLQARLAAETREKAALEEGIRAARAEAEARTQELAARIRQLDAQVAHLQQTQPAGSAAEQVLRRPAAAPTQRSRRPAATPALTWPKVGLILGLGAALTGGAWALLWHPATPAAGTSSPTARPARQPRDPADENLEAAAPSLFDIQPDTVALSPAEEAAQAPAAAAPDSVPAPTRREELLDSVAVPDDDI